MTEDDLIERLREPAPLPDRGFAAGVIDRIAVERARREALVHAVVWALGLACALAAGPVWTQLVAVSGGAMAVAGFAVVAAGAWSILARG